MSLIKIVRLLKIVAAKGDFKGILLDALYSSHSKFNLSKRWLSHCTTDFTFLAFTFTCLRKGLLEFVVQKAENKRKGPASGAFFLPVC